MGGHTSRLTSFSTIKTRRLLTTVVLLLLITFSISCGIMWTTGTRSSSLGQTVSTHFLYMCGGGTVYLQGFKFDYSTYTFTAVPSITPALPTDCFESQIIPISSTLKLIAAEALFGGGVYVYKIDPTTGSLTQVSGSPLFSGTSLETNFLVEPTNHYIYGTGPGNATDVYSIDQNTGAISFVKSNPFAAGTNYSPLGGFQFGQVSPILQYYWDNVDSLFEAMAATAGDLTTQAPLALAVPAFCSTNSNFVITAAGGFLYTSCFNGASTAANLYSYQITNPATGALSAITGASTTSLPVVDAYYAIDPSVTHLFANGASYNINPANGQLTIYGSGTTAQSGPVVSSDGKFVASASGSVLLQTISGGTLTFGPNSPFALPGTTAAHVTFDPTNTILISSAVFSSKTWAMRVAPDGTLTIVNGGNPLSTTGNASTSRDNQFVSFP